MTRIINGRFRYVTLPKQLANGWKYRLLEDITFLTFIFPLRPFCHELIEYTKAGKLTLKRGCQWNGASGPCPDHEGIMMSSCLHDALCQMYAMGVITKFQRCQADHLLADMTREEMIRLANQSKSAVLRAVRTVWAFIWSECVWLAVRGYTCIQ